MPAPSIATQQSAKAQREVIPLPGNRQLVTKGFVANGDRQLLLSECANDVVGNCLRRLVEILNTKDDHAAWVRCRLPSALLDKEGRVEHGKLIECKDLGNQLGALSVHSSSDANHLEIYFHRRRFCGETPAPAPVLLQTIDLTRVASRRLRLHS